MLTETQLKNKQRTRENRLRRVANRKGLSIHKSHCRDKGDVEYNKFRICDLRSGKIVFGDFGGYSKTIDEVEAYLYNSGDTK